MPLQENRDDSNPVVHLDNVTVVRGDRTILENITLKVERGEHWVLVGPNGSGKTSLLNLVNAWLWPSGGSVTVLGERYGRVDVREMRKRIGVVGSALYERIPSGERCLEVVLSGLYASLGIYEDPGPGEIDRARRSAGRFGLEKVLENRYGVLSFGERQRALLARALVAQPELLILDEPFEGLDLGAREQMIRLLQELTSSPAGPTLLLVTHRIEEIPAVVTHAALLQDGRLLASGKRDTVLTSENLGRAMGCRVEVLRRNGRLAAMAL